MSRTATTDDETMKILCVSKNFTRLEADLERLDEDELVMMVDFDRCIACGACQFACQTEHAREGAGWAGRPGAIQVKLKEGACTSALNLPLSCRHCEAPCEFRSPYNFWITCPASDSGRGPEVLCDRCQERLERGLMPACATRCSMKCITFGHPKEVALALNEKRLRELGDLLIEG